MKITVLEMRAFTLFRPCPCQKRLSCSRSSNRTSSTLILSNIFPDPTASAAGVRTQALLDGLARNSKVHLVTSVSDAQHKEQRQPHHNSSGNEPPNSASPRTIIDDLTRRKSIIDWSHLPPNRSAELLEFSKKHTTTVEKIIFDRFYIEEAYSFALREYYPDTALILDMQDMHSLRGGREKIVKDWDSKNYTVGADPLQVLEAVMAYIPSSDSPQLLRELGSIHRSDLTLVCSPYELHLLESTYGISSSKLCLAPFFVPSSQIQQTEEERSRIPRNPDTGPTFVFCGGFKHPPNVDAVRLLLRVIWPSIRTALPAASLHIHGAYCPAEFHKAHDPSGKRVHVHGYTPSLEQVFDRPGCILLAPLRFGAGIKGKIIDAWTFGMPVVTTPVGSEGMIPLNENNDSFGGKIALSIDEFVNMAVELAVAKSIHADAVNRGQGLLRRMQDHETNWERVQSSIEETVAHLRPRRQADYMRALLWHHSARSTEFFSRWIELKETSKGRMESPLIESSTPLSSNDPWILTQLKQYVKSYWK